MAEHFIAEANEIEPGKTLPVSVAGHRLLVCHSKDQYYVIQNQCSHAMARLTGGKLRGHKIFCPLHSAAFDLRDGSALSAPATKPIRTYRAHVTDGRIFAELPDSDSDADAL
ncbi:MAG: non-heme iron oxygenase ferredoxin subunit [Pseudomonadota bacterium]